MRRQNYLTPARTWLRAALIAVLAVLWAVPGVLAAGSESVSRVMVYLQVDDVGDTLVEPTPWQNWQLLLPILITILVDVFSKLTWPESRKVWLMVAVTFVLTAFGMYLQGTLDTTPVDVIAEVLKVMVATAGYYYVFWKPVGASRKIHEATGG